MGDNIQIIDMRSQNSKYENIKNFRRHLVKKGCEYRSKLTPFEFFIKRYFEEKGYVVFRQNILKKSLPELPDVVCDFLTEEIGGDNNFIKIHRWGELFLKKGFPDFFIYKINEGTLEDLRFVEAKSNNDPFSISQIKWLVSNNYPYDLIHIMNKDEEETEILMGELEDLQKQLWILESQKLEG